MGPSRTPRGLPARCNAGCGAAADDNQPAEQVDWAGLPINLDLAFSPQQRDKVYTQHLLRKRGTQLRRWLPAGSHVCVCEQAANDERL